MAKDSLINNIIELKKKKAIYNKEKIRFKEMIRIGLGGTIGGPTFVILGKAIGIAGPGLLISILISGILMIIFVANFSELALSLSISGVGYRVFKESLGPASEFLFAWFVWIGNLIFSALSAIGFVYSLKIFFPILATEYIKDIIAIAVLSVFFLLNLKWPDRVGRIMQILTMLMVFGFLFFIFMGLFGGPSKNPNFSFDILKDGYEFSTIISQSASIFVIFCIYEWLSSFTMMMEKITELQAPKKNLPKTYLLAILIAVLIYWHTALATMLNIGSNSGPVWNEVLSSDVPLATVFSKVLGWWGLLIMGLVGMIATLTSINSGIQMSTHLLAAMGRDDFLPIIFDKTHKGVKYVALTLSYIFSCIIAVIGNVSLMTGITSFIFLSSMVFLNIAVILLRKNRPDLDRPWKVPFYPYIPVIGASGALFLMFSIPLRSIGIGLLLFSIGLVYFFIWVYIFGHSSVLQRDNILKEKDELIKQKELEILMMKSRLAQEISDQLLDSGTIDKDKLSEEKLNLILTLKNLEAVDGQEFSTVNEILDAQEEIDNKLEKLTLLLRLEELERLEQKGFEELDNIMKDRAKDDDVLLKSTGQGESELEGVIRNRKGAVKNITLFSLLKNIISKEKNKLESIADKDQDDILQTIKEKEYFIEKLEELERMERKILKELESKNKKSKDIPQIKHHAISRKINSILKTILSGKRMAPDKGASSSTEIFEENIVENSQNSQDFKHGGTIKSESNSSITVGDASDHSSGNHDGSKSGLGIARISSPRKSAYNLKKDDLNAVSDNLTDIPLKTGVIEESYISDKKNLNKNKENKKSASEEDEKLQLISSLKRIEHEERKIHDELENLRKEKEKEENGQ